jgi:hypothetical protein
MATARTIRIPYITSRLNVPAFLASIAIYAVFSLYLYLPHARCSISAWRPVFIFSAVFAAAGAYLVSGRWVSRPVASFFTGLLYGFGPFVLGFALYHPAASLLPGAIAWSLLPAAHRPYAPSKNSAAITAVLALAPFIVIILFFVITSYWPYRFFPMPLRADLHFRPAIELLSPLAAKPLSFPVFNFYHAPLAPLIFGLLLFIRLRRRGVIILLAAGIILGLWVTLGIVSPVAWALVSVLCVCVMTGAGFEAMAIANEADGPWLLVCAAATGASAVACALAAKYYPPLALAAAWYLASAALSFLFMLLTYTKNQYHTLRLILLCLLLAADIFLTAGLVIDKLF